MWRRCCSAAASSDVDVVNHISYTPLIFSILFYWVVSLFFEAGRLVSRPMGVEVGSRSWAQIKNLTNCQSTEEVGAMVYLLLRH